MIQTFHAPSGSPDSSELPSNEQKVNDPSNPSNAVNPSDSSNLSKESNASNVSTPMIPSNDANPNQSHFAQILRGIAIELYGDQQESEKRYGHASNLLVVPLRNIINHEIAHAMDLKRRYILVKRQFDSCCTTISTLKSKIEELKNPKPEEEAANPDVSPFGKLKMGFGKLIQSANPTIQDLQDRLAIARHQLTEIIKAFDHSKMQFMEALDIVEQKMNVEVVYYVQQFFEFMRQCKSGNITPLPVQSLHQVQKQEQVPPPEQPEELKEQKEDVPDVVKEVDSEAVNEEPKEDAAAVVESSDFVSHLQIDSMIKNPGMDKLDEVNLNSPDPNNVTDDVDPK